MSTVPIYCERCGDVLDQAKAVWLELNIYTGCFHKDGEVPQEESQGYFSFGSACAKAVLDSGGNNKRIRAATR